MYIVRISDISMQVVSLFLIMIIGYGARLFGLIDKRTTDGLSKFMVYVTNPLLIIVSFQQVFASAELSGQSLKGKIALMLTVVAISIIVHLAATLIAMFMFRGKNIRESAVYRFSIIFSNCGFMGYPLLRAAFPESGMFYGACYVLFFTVYMWSFGVFLLSAGSGKGGGFAIRKTLLNPGFLAAVVGVLLFVLGIKLPTAIMGTFSMTADMTFPLSMIIIGSMLREIDLKDVFINPDVYIVAFIKLLALPLLILLACVILGIKEGNTYICVIMASTPVATKAPILASLYGGNKSKALACVELTTILSVFTIPLVMFITNQAI